MKVRKLVDPKGNLLGYGFKCPGCGDHHSVYTEKQNNQGAQWKFNGDMDNPTFSPSLLVTCGHYVNGYKGDTCWCKYNAEHPDSPGPNCYRCHSFIRDGKIQFLSDCTHALAGKTVELKEIND